MQVREQPQQQQTQQSNQQTDIYSYPLPIRIKHPSWSARKGTYEQLLYYLKTLQSPQEQIIISGTAYTVETLLPHFENLVHQKHAGVLLKGLECVEQILIMDKKAHSKHCIRSLVDKGIEFFPLLSQQRKAILEKFLDILELSKIQSSFLKNKLNLPHQKSVMYVIQVIGVLNMTSLQTTLSNLTKKHPKKCVRQLAAQIAQQLQQAITEISQQTKGQFQSNKPTSKPANYSSAKPKTQNSTSRYTIQKLPHYEQLPTKKQQQFSSQLAQKIDSVIEEYTFSQLPNFSHILRLMIDDNNHIINVNAIKCLIAIFDKEKDDGVVKNSLVPISFPLLFLFNKFKSHKTHPINFLMLSLIESILQSPSNRVIDLFQAISEGLSSAGSKANVKFGCGLAFFRVISLIYKSEDLYKCTINENMENENEDLTEKMERFEGVKMGKTMMKMVEKIMGILQKDKKYQTEIYLIKYAIGLDTSGMAEVIGNSNGSMKQTMNKTKQVKPGQQNQSKNKLVEGLKGKKSEGNNISNDKAGSKSSQVHLNANPKKPSVSGGLESRLTKTIKQGPRFEQINLQETLNRIIKLVQTAKDKQNPRLVRELTSLLQKSQQQFWQCVKEKRFQMFYLCELLDHFISNYSPNDYTIQKISQYLISLLKIVSLLKPLTTLKEISLSNVSQLLLVALSKLVISQQIHQVLQNIHQNYGFQIIFQSLQQLYLNNNHQIKKKNKKLLLQWLENNTPALQLNQHYYQLIHAINQKHNKKPQNSSKYTNTTQKTHFQAQTQIYPRNQTHQNYHHQNPKTLKFNNQQSNNPKQPTVPSSHQLSPRKTTNKSFIIQPQSSGKKNQFNSNLLELENINLSKIEKNITESNEYYDEDMDKSSFHQHLQEHLKQIRTHRSYQEYEEPNFGISKNLQHDTSRQYLKHLQSKEENDKQFRKKTPQIHQQTQLSYATRNINILQSSPFKSQKSQNQSLNHSRESVNQSRQSDKNKTQQEAGDKMTREEQNYDQKCSQVERRRTQRERERKQFISRIKQQFKPIINPNQSHHSNEESESDPEDKQENKQDKIVKEKSRLREYSYEGNGHDGNEGQEENDRQISRNQSHHTSRQSSPQHNHQSSQHQINMDQYEQSFTKLSSLKNNYLRNSPTHLPPNYQALKQTYQQIPPSSTNTLISHHQQAKEQPDCSLLSSTSSGQFKYREINHQKLSYMLNSTSNPYQHLRNLILIPFKSSHKKHHFLKQLLHFLTNHVEFKIPQPYSSLILLIILMFAEIKEDKTLIQPLQSLYEFMAKQSTTNDFIKTIINLFHTVIEETLPQNRKFLITILLKSMIRMLPFIEDGLSLLRDIQQFYQIGEMVYFEMFQQEYTQIKTYIQEQAVYIVLQKAMEEESNLISIIEGWLGTGWKDKVMETMIEFQSDGFEQNQTSKR